MKSPTARGTALYLLDKITGEGRLLSEMSGALDRLDPAERARAQRLTTDTLRGIERADRIISRFLRKPPPLTVHNILRLGTVELCAGGDAHGVVNDMVGLLGNHRRYAKLKGLINAVLRQVAEDGPPRWNDLRIPRIRSWLREPLVQAWGKGAVNTMERVQFAGAPLDLSPKGDAAKLAETTGGMLLPTGSVRLSDYGQVSAIAGFETGDWWVQDAAAAIPVQVLAPQKGERVLDMCAAPGGKTLQIAALGADVTALDDNARRMERVTENLTRTKLQATTLVGDALSHEGQYDAILLDAPCSATGTLRRHPDLPFAKDGSEFGALMELQAQMLDHALTLLKPGGRLVYCTCSLLPDEGEVQVDDALARHAGLTVDRHALDRTGIDPAWITTEGGLRLRPDYWADQGGMDGFYIACLRR